MEGALSAPSTESPEQGVLDTTFGVTATFGVTTCDTVYQKQRFKWRLTIAIQHLDDFVSLVSSEGY